MVDAHAAQSKEIAWLKDKVADLEDKSRRNNIKIRGIPESTSSMQLPQYAQELFYTLVPTMSGLDLSIDRIHRLPKPLFISALRDVLLRVHFYQVKERIMSAFRQMDHLPEHYFALQLLPDQSCQTLQWCKNLATVTKALCNHKILHK